jgi:hypothetical protein
VPLALRRGHLWAVAFYSEGELPIDLGLLHDCPLHRIAEVLVHCLRLQLVWLQDGSKHHGCCGHVLCGIEKVLCAVTALSSWSHTFPDIAEDAVEFLHEGVELFLLLIKGGLASEDARLAPAHVLFLIGSLLVPSAIVIRRRCCHKAGPFWCFFGVGVSPGRKSL